MIEHMDFNKGAYIAYASDYNPSQWISMLKGELDERPLIYSGETEGGAGHAFVLDGYGQYGGDDVFHVNFGWGGSNNGYYCLANLDAAAGHNYSYNCEAIFDFYPDAESSYIYNLQYDNSYLPGLQFVDPFSTDSRFRISVGITNAGNTTYNGKLAAKLLDKDGFVKYDFDVLIDSELGWTDQVTGYGVGVYGYMQLYIQLPDNPVIAFGDKIVIYCTTDEDQTVYEPIKELTDGTVLNALPVMPVAFIKTEDSYDVNDWFTFELMNNDYVYAGTKWTITAPDGTVTENIAQSQRWFQLTQSGEYKIQAAVAPSEGDAVVENITAIIYVANPSFSE